MNPNPMHKDMRMKLRTDITKLYETYNVDTCRKVRDSLRELQRLNGNE
jgi:hypothetical protein